MNHRLRGFSLLEVLLATVILAIGLLGIAALQVTTNVYTESGLRRGQAAALSREIVERMRVNVSEARGGNYDFVTLPAFSTTCAGVAANCTAAELREHDLRLWSARVTALLPSGNATIATLPDPPDPALPSQISITLRWDESRGERALVQQVFEFELFGVE